MIMKAAAAMAVADLEKVMEMHADVRVAVGAGPLLAEQCQRALARGNLIKAELEPLAFFSSHSFPPLRFTLLSR